MKERTFKLLLIVTAPIIASVFVVGELVLLEHYLLRVTPSVVKVHHKDKS